MGLGAYFGYFVSQNGKGHVLGHVSKRPLDILICLRHLLTFNAS